MDKNIPNKVIREIVSEILAERGNSIINNYYRLAEERQGIDEKTAKEIGIDSKLNSMLASRVLEDSVPIKEVIDLVLTPDEVKLARKKCDKWLEQEHEQETIL